MRNLFFVGGVIFMMSSAFAQSAVSKAEIEQLIVGKTFYFGGDATATYGTDSSYNYKAGINNYRGRYTVSDGRVCVDFSSGQSRCDRIVKEGNNYFLLNSNGGRFPMTVK